MTATVLTALLQNAALLLALVFVVDSASGRQRLEGRPLWQALVGVILGGLGIGLLLASFRLESGIVFDTRSVLLAISGLFLGAIPTVVAMVMVAAFRLQQGGAAAWVGAAVVLASGGIGIAWRHYHRRRLDDISWRELYALGVVVHVVMLALMLALPWDTARRVLAGIGLPVLLVYPLATVALGLLMAGRLRRERATTALGESEERYRALFENNHAVMLIVDLAAGAIVDANPAACQFYGWTRAELQRMPIARINTLPPAELAAELARATATQNYHFLFTHRRADGSLRNVEVFSGPVTIDGRPLLYSIIHDITERRQAEAAARERLSLLQLAGDMARFGGWSVELAEGRVIWSDEVAAIHDMPPGYSPLVAEGIGFYAPEWREKITAAVDRCAREGTPYDEEMEILTAHGRRVWVRTIGTAGRDDQGRIIRVHGAFQDISDRKRAEAELRAREEQFRAMFQLASIGMAQADVRTGQWLRVNDKLCKITGYSADEMLRLRVPELTHPDDRERDWAAFQRVVRGEAPDYRLDKRYVRKDGTVSWVSVNMTVIRDADGQPIRTVATIEDINERKRADEETRRLLAEVSEAQRGLLSVIEDQKMVETEREKLLAQAETSRRALLSVVEDQRRTGAALRDSEERFRRAVLDSPFPIMLHAEDGTILQVSNSWCEVTGYGRDELTTIRDWTERAFGDRQTLVQADIDRLYDLAQRVFQGDYPIRTKQGDTRIWEFSAAPLGRLDDGRRLVISMAMDVTERRAAEQAVRELNVVLEQRVRDRTAELQAANQELEAFSYSVSHDLRAPLRAMDGFSMALLEDYAGKLDETAQHYLRRIRAGSQQMAELIDDLLNLSRLSREILRRGRVDLTAMAGRIGEELQRQHPARQVELVVAPHLTAHADEGMLRVVLTNLLGNAWKFTGRCAAARVEVGARKQDGERVFFVADNGAGFDMAHASRLFGAFQRLHSTQEFEGNGIGLALVQRIIRRHGGRVWAEGEVGRGATLFFTLGKERN